MHSGGQQIGITDMKQFLVDRGAVHTVSHPQDQSTTPHARIFPSHTQSHEQVHLHPLRLDQHPNEFAQDHWQFSSQLQLQTHPYQHVQPQSIAVAHYQKTQLPHQPVQAVHQLSLGSDSQELTSATAAPISQFKPLITSENAFREDHETPQEGERGGGNRWPTEETIALLRVRSEIEASLRDSGLKGPLWEEVSRKLTELGYNRSSKKCKEKFENVHKYYKKTKNGKASRQDGKSYRFFSELEALYATHNETGGSGSGNSGIVDGMIRGQGGFMNTGPACSLATEAVSVQRPEASSRLKLSSDTSGDDVYDNLQENDEQKSRKKRKRRTLSSMKLFFENLTKQVMEQQEALHKKFLEAIELRDQERLIREETYRREEMARSNREHELRTQEHTLAATRDAALVAFLQKIIGENSYHHYVPVPPTLSTSSDIQDDPEQDLYDINTRRWPMVEVHALIQLRSGMETNIQEAGFKSQLWDDISAAMACMGYDRSAKQCKEKWESINTFFRKAKDSCTKHPENVKAPPYFNYLETLYQGGVLNSPSTKNNIIESNSENLPEEDYEMTQCGNTEIMAIVPTGENARGSASINETTAGQSFSYQENVIDSDQIPTKRNQSCNFPDCNNNPSASLALNSGGICDGENLSTTSRSLEMDGFVEDILEMQQHQHEKLMKEYEQMDQGKECKEQERLQIDLVQEQSHTNGGDNEALLALVHKLVGESCEFTMTTPSSTDSRILE